MKKIIGLFLIFLIPLHINSMESSKEERSAWAHQSLVAHVINGSILFEKGSVEQANPIDPEHTFTVPQTYITFGDYYFMLNHPERGLIRYGIRHTITLEQARAQLARFLQGNRRLIDPLLQERLAGLRSAAQVNLNYFRTLAMRLPQRDPFGNNFAVTALFNKTARGAALLAGDANALLSFSEAIDQNPSFAAYFEQQAPRVQALQQQAIARLH